MGTDKQKALKGCFQAGVVAFAAAATTDVPEKTDELAKIFRRFGKDQDVGKELSPLVRGNSLNIEELKYLFEQAGYEQTTLPSFDFEKAVAAFEAAFLTAAAQEPTLRGTIQTNQLLTQTRLQRELVAGMRDLVALLRRAQFDSVGVRAGKVLVMVEGKQEEYALPWQGGPPHDKEPDTLRTAYLNKLFEKAARVSLAAINPKAASDSKALLNLDAVYTALLTLTPEEQDRMERGDLRDRDARQLSALAQLNRHPQLVLLGDPDSGKTTFVNFVAMCLSGEGLGRNYGNLESLTAPLPDDDGADQEQRQPWNHGELLPVRVILRDFAAARILPEPGHSATGEHLWQFIVKGLEASAIGEYAPYLHKELLEQGGLLLFDGLDEVPEADQRREQIKQAVEDFTYTFHRCRVLITSRIYAYQQQAWRCPPFLRQCLPPSAVGRYVVLLSVGMPILPKCAASTQKTPGGVLRFSKGPFSEATVCMPLPNGPCS